MPLANGSSLPRGPRHADRRIGRAELCVAAPVTPTPRRGVGRPQGAAASTARDGHRPEPVLSQIASYSALTACCPRRAHVARHGAAPADGAEWCLFYLRADVEPADQRSEVHAEGRPRSRRPSRRMPAQTRACPLRPLSAAVRATFATSPSTRATSRQLAGTTSTSSARRTPPTRSTATSRRGCRTSSSFRRSSTSRSSIVFFMTVTYASAAILRRTSVGRSCRSATTTCVTPASTA